TSSFFATLATPPLVGRVFGAEEDAPGRDAVAVLSQGAWRRRFGADPRAVGSSIRLGDRAVTIVGVMPESFGLLFPQVEVWLPMAFPAGAGADTNRGNENLSVVGRVMAGVSIRQSREEMAAIAARSIDKVPERRAFLVNAKWSADLVPL